MIEETNAAEHYERTKFNLCKDNICLDLTLTYVLMDNFLSLYIKEFSLSIILKKLISHYYYTRFKKKGSRDAYGQKKTVRHFLNEFAISLVIFY